MFKVTNKNIRTKSMIFFFCLSCYFKLFHTFFSVSVIEFEQVNLCWSAKNRDFQATEGNFFIHCEFGKIWKNSAFLFFSENTLSFAFSLKNKHYENFEKRPEKSKLWIILKKVTSVHFHGYELLNRIP